MKKIYSILSNISLPNSFWDEDTSTACFLNNRASFSVIDKTKPEEIWSSTPINYYDLKKFKSLPYGHVDNGKL